MSKKFMIGDRMKAYEKAYNIQMPNRMPVILRLDGKAFHTLMRGADKPFDSQFKNAMDNAAIYLISEIPDISLAYLQSDEINLLLVNYKSLDQMPYFDNKIQKLTSVAASIASVAFNDWWDKAKKGYFDCRAFVLPKEEVCNYFIWRQQDWTRNSVMMAARSLYSQKELHGKNGSELQEMMFEKGLNWNDMESWKKRGRCCSRGEKQVYSPTIDKKVVRTDIITDNVIPIFTQDRDYIEKQVYPQEERKNE